MSHFRISVPNGHQTYNVNLAIDNAAISMHKSVSKSFKNSPISIVQLINPMIGHLFSLHHGVHLDKILAAHKLRNYVALKFFIANGVIHATTLVKTVPMDAKHLSA
jgi:hypothetical protein